LFIFWFVDCGLHYSNIQLIKIKIKNTAAQITISFNIY
jgi:hypothetical protein